MSDRGDGEKERGREEDDELRSRGTGNFCLSVCGQNFFLYETYVCVQVTLPCLFDWNALFQVHFDDIECISCWASFTPTEGSPAPFLNPMTFMPSVKSLE